MPYPSNQLLFHEYGDKPMRSSLVLGPSPPIMKVPKRRNTCAISSSSRLPDATLTQIRSYAHLVNDSTSAPLMSMRRNEHLLPLDIGFDSNLPTFGMHHSMLPMRPSAAVFPHGTRRRHSKRSKSNKIAVDKTAVGKGASPYADEDEDDDIEGAPSSSEKPFVPISAVIMSDRAYEIAIELPGVSKEDIGLDFRGDSFVLTAIRKGPLPKNIELKEKVDWNVNANAVQAKYANGLLMLSFPWKAAYCKRSIPIVTDEDADADADAAPPMEASTAKDTAVAVAPPATDN